MRTVTIRECAFRACKACGSTGSDLLMDAIAEAFDGDVAASHIGGDNAVLSAIVPDIRSSVREERQFPPAQDGALAAGTILGMLGSLGQCVAGGCDLEKSATDHEDWGD